MEMGLYRPQRGKGLRQTPKAGNAAAHGWSVGAAHALGVEPASIAKIRAQKELFAFWKRDAILLIVHTTM
jgi:hypothetical protein